MILISREYELTWPLVSLQFFYSIFESLLPTLIIGVIIEFTLGIRKNNLFR